MSHPNISPLCMQIHQLPWAQGLDYPCQGVAESSGMDMRAAITEDLILEPGVHALVPTGLQMAIPVGYEGQVRPRSGLAAQDGITVLNSPGTIDAGYRGEIKIILINLGKKPFTVVRGMRVAQLVIAPVVSSVRWESVSSFASSQRGEGGFGSTGRL